MYIMSKWLNKALSHKENSPHAIPHLNASLLCKALATAAKDFDGITAADARLVAELMGHTECMAVEYYHQNDLLSMETAACAMETIYHWVKESIQFPARAVPGGDDGLEQVAPDSPWQALPEEGGWPRGAARWPGGPAVAAAAAATSPHSRTGPEAAGARAPQTTYPSTEPSRGRPNSTIFATSAAANQSHQRVSGWSHTGQSCHHRYQVDSVTGQAVREGASWIHCQADSWSCLLHGKAAENSRDHPAVWAPQCCWQGHHQLGWAAGSISRSLPAQCLEAVPPHLGVEEQAHPKGGPAATPAAVAEFNFHLFWFHLCVLL